MKVRVVVVGGVKGPLGQVIGDYQTRAGRYWKLEVDEVRAGAPGKKASPDDCRKSEEPRILARLPDRGMVLLMSRDGRGIASSELAGLLERAMVGAEPDA